MDLGPIDLDLTLDCGQAFRWRRSGGVWKGVVRGKVVRLEQKGRTVDVETDLPSRQIESYFRTDDDLEEIGRQLDRDNRIGELRKRFLDLRLLRQEPWECSASFVLATNANVPRIKKMIESVCTRFGDELEPGVFGFPGPQRIVSNAQETEACGLGYRCDRFLRFARHAADGDLNFEEMASLPYEQCIDRLMEFEGIGNKVADCISLFCLDHLEAFPVDVRIKRTMEQDYGITGSYRAVSGWAREHFGDFAGYAQEYLYLATDPRRLK